MGSLASFQGGIERGRRDGDDVEVPAVADEAVAEAVADEADWSSPADAPVSLDQWGRHPSAQNGSAGRVVADADATSWAMEVSDDIGQRADDLVADADVDHAIAEVTAAAAQADAIEAADEPVAAHAETIDRFEAPAEIHAVEPVTADEPEVAAAATASTRTGLKRRVRGAQMPDTGRRLPTSPRSRSSPRSSAPRWPACSTA